MRALTPAASAPSSSSSKIAPLALASPKAPPLLPLLCDTDNRKFGLLVVSLHAAQRATCLACAPAYPVASSSTLAGCCTGNQPFSPRSCVRCAPRCSLCCSALCYVLLPGSIGYGQVTPANYKLPYRTNGLTAYIVSHAVFAVVCVIPQTRAWFGITSNALVDNWCPAPLILQPKRCCNAVAGAASWSWPTSTAILSPSTGGCFAIVRTRCPHPFPSQLLSRLHLPHPPRRKPLASPRSFDRDKMTVWCAGLQAKWILSLRYVHGR
jgi:hypothetical protein